MEIAYGLPKSIHEVCAISEILAVGNSIPAMPDLERKPMVAEDSVGKVPPSGCDNPDLGGKPNLQEDNHRRLTV